MYPINPIWTSSIDFKACEWHSQKKWHPCSYDLLRTPLKRIIYDLFGFLSMLPVSCVQTCEMNFSLSLVESRLSVGFTKDFISFSLAGSWTQAFITKAYLLFMTLQREFLSLQVEIFTSAEGWNSTWLFLLSIPSVSLCLSMFSVIICKVFETIHKLTLTKMFFVPKPNVYHSSAISENGCWISTNKLLKCYKY